MEKGELLRIADEVYEELFCPQPLALEWLKENFKPLIDWQILRTVENTQLELARIYQQVIPYVACYLDTNFVLRLLTKRDEFFVLHTNFLRVLNGLDIPIRVFKHVQEEVKSALNMTVGKQIISTPKKLKRLGKKGPISPFAIEYFCDCPDQSLSGYLLALHRRFSCLMRRSNIEIVETPDVNRRELHHLEGCLRDNFCKLEKVAHNDALSILSVRRLNEEHGMVIVKTKDARIPIYNLVTMVSLDFSLTQSFPRETSIPLEIIFRLDEPYAILTGEEPVYHKLEKEYCLAEKKKERLQRSILCKLSEMLVRKEHFTMEHTEVQK